MIDANHKAFIEERIKESKQARAIGREDKEFRERAIYAGVCPECGGRLVRRNRFIEFFTDTVRYLCVECDAKHSLYYGD